MIRQIQKYLPKYLLILLILSFSTTSCEEPEDYIPYVYVNLEVYLSNISNSNLRIAPSYKIIPDQGVNGIILYRQSMMEEQNDFIAFDLTCTYQPTENCILKIDSSGFILECPCCDSEFFITDGFPVSPPAKWQLKQYRTSYNPQTKIIRIFN